MAQEQLLTLAKHGDYHAISLLINHALRPKGVNATVSLDGDCLSIVLESAKLPLEMPCTQLIEKGLKNLGVRDFAYAIIYGRRSQDIAPVWQQKINLNPLSDLADVDPPQTNFTVTETTTNNEIEELILPDSLNNDQAFPNFFTVITSCFLIVLSIGGLIFTYPKYSQVLFAFTAKLGNLLSLPKFSLKSQEDLTKLPIIETKTLNNVPKKNIESDKKLNKSLTAKKSAILLPHTLPVAKIQQPKKEVIKPEKVAITNKAISQPTAKNPANPGIILPQFLQPTKDNSNQVINQITNFAFASIQRPIDQNMTINIKAVGDTIPGTNYPIDKLPLDPNNLFANVLPLLKDKDILFGNFESTLTDHPYSAKDISRGMVFAFRTPPSYKNILKEAGFDILSVANNHSFDFNKKGFTDTIENINSTGIKAVGKKGEIRYHKVKGLTVAFIAFSNYDSVHNSIIDLKNTTNLVKEAKKNADIVVISFHAGAEGTDAVHVSDRTEYFFGENRGNVVKFARTAIDAGADLILGHGPHVTRALELYKGKLIAYSLGNFLGYRTLSTADILGSSLILSVNLNVKGDFVSGEIIPVTLDEKGIPYPDDRGSSINLISNLTNKDFPNTPLKISSDGKILPKVSDKNTLTKEPN